MLPADNVSYVLPWTRIYRQLSRILFAAVRIGMLTMHIASECKIPSTASVELLTTLSIVKSGMTKGSHGCAALVVFTVSLSIKSSSAEDTSQHHGRPEVPPILSGKACKDHCKPKTSCSLSQCRPFCPAADRVFAWHGHKLGSAQACNTWCFCPLQTVNCSPCRRSYEIHDLHRASISAHGHCLLSIFYLFYDGAGLVSDLEIVSVLLSLERIIQVNSGALSKGNHNSIYQTLHAWGKIS